MERRHQVFVSSTFVDLQDERAAVVSALLQLEAIPAGMELFPAADDDAWTLIERVIDASDYYLLVIGGKYGSIDPATELSFTEKEYDFAIERGKPVMAFLHGDPDSIPLGKSEQDAETREKLTQFRAKVKGSKHVKYWDGASDLQGKVALSFANFRQQYPAVGWIRGDVQTSTESLTELNELRKQLGTAQRQLAAVRASPPPGTEELAQGKEKAIVDVAVSGRVRGRGDRYGTSRRWRWTVSPTWDQVFAALGPELLDEGEQRAFRRALDAWLANRFRGEAADVIGEILDDGETASDIDLSILDESFGTLVVQLRALGLITHSERRRSVSDKGTYWALTPYGDGHLTTLRAIRRQSSPAAQEGSPSPRDEGDDQDEDDEAVNGFESETADEERDTTGG